MADDTPQMKHPVRDWRFAITIGISVSFGLATSQGVSKALEPSLGYLGAFIVSVLVAGVVGGGAAAVIYWTLERVGSDKT